MTELYDALDDCLEAMARGASVEHALKRHPKLEHELRPLLETSLLARDARRIHVPLDVRRRGRSLLMDKVHQAQEGRNMARGRMIPLFPRLALTGLLVGALVLTSTGLVSASSTSLPGQQLYPVKRTWESVRLLLTFSPQQRDLVESDFEQERLDEISELLGRRISAPITFSGLLSMQADGRWTVSGIPVSVGNLTTLPATPISAGAPVTVTGVTRPDGVVEAQDVQVLQPGASLPPLEPSEAEEHGDSKSGEDGHTATATPVPGVTPQVPAESESEHTTFQFSGVVQSMDGMLWRINGQPVYVDKAQITGQITLGSIVRFQGYYTTDGKFVVTTIEPQKSSSGSKKDGSHDSGDDGKNDGGEGED